VTVTCEGLYEKRVSGVSRTYATPSFEAGGDETVREAHAISLQLPSFTHYRKWDRVILTFNTLLTFTSRFPNA
jgi:hypothetical protein